MSDLIKVSEQKINHMGFKRMLTRAKNFSVESEDKEEDALTQLGFGIVEYINILYTLIWTFILFSVLLIPTMMNFRTGEVYMGDPREGYASGMIGNLGYSTIECLHTPISLGKVTLHCSYGHIGQIVDFGITNPNMGSYEDTCVNDAQNKRCKPSSNAVITKKLAEAKGRQSHFIQFSAKDLLNDSKHDNICYD